ncbi:MAG TPA: ribosome biogenesis GTPase Der [Acidimicrobiia bacterium]|nr:ribosome biogenesis GTPase Der [Acidimicrobiia bacterium]
MSLLPVVAIVGRPNVGKSTLVNRILRRRAAVVEERPGVTRDRKEFTAEWNDRRFVLVDTGGWELGDEGLQAGIRRQAEAAIGGADVVLFVADVTTPVGDDDIAVARMVQESGIPVVLAANKVDGPKAELEASELWALGLGEPFPISALHGRNTGDLLERVIEVLPARPEGEHDESEIPTLAILGRPNVGKSTLLNRLLGEDRVLVSDVPGTTRDAIDAVVELDGQPFRIYDTAGIRRSAKVKDSTEFYSVIRAREALAEADVALLVLDATDGGATHQEQRLAEEIAESGTGIVVILNKWDAADDVDKSDSEDSVGDRLAFIGWAPVLRMSARTGARTKRLGAAVRAVLEARRLRIPTPELNRKLREWQEMHPPPVRKGRRARIIYAVQAGTEPPTIVLFLRGGDLGPDYLRYLENRLRRDNDFIGSPIRFISRKREPRRPRV